MIVRRLLRLVCRSLVVAPEAPRVPASRCYYARLGLFPGASLHQTRSAYEAARRAGLNPVAQKLVDEAYSVLSDPVRREIYHLVRRGLVAHGLAADPLQAGAERSLRQVMREFLRRAWWKLRR